MLGDIIVLRSIWTDWLAFLSIFVQSSTFSTYRFLDTFLRGGIKNFILSAAGYTLLRCCFPSRISRACNTLLLSFIVNRCGYWTNLARFADTIPHWLLRRTDTISGMQRLRLALLSGGVVNFSAIARRVTYVGSEVVSKVIGASFAGLFAEVEVESIGTLEAVIC